MLSHHIQNDIIHHLVRERTASFSELKPDRMESNAFNYHIKSLLREGFVCKSDDGSYTLTRLGMRLGLNSHLTAKQRLSLAHPVFLIMPIDNDGKILVRRRTAHPMYGYLGFIHGEPEHDELLDKSAAKAMDRYANLECDYEIKGSGYARFLSGGELESFTSFTLLLARNPRGTLKKKSSTGENIWMEVDELLAHPKLFPNMKPLIKKSQEEGLFFLDELHTIN